MLVPTCLHFPSPNPSKFNKQNQRHRKIIDFRIDFYTVLAPTWRHLGPQVGAILALKIAQEPPKTPPKTHLEARTRPDAKNATKMEPPTPKNDAPDPSFWIDFCVNFCYFWAHSSIRFKIKIQKQTQNQIQNQKTKVETN